MEKELITMTQNELDKYQTIKKLLAKEITVGDAAKMINCTPRHARRLRNKVRQHGAKGIVHGLRGKKSNNKTDPEIWNKAGEIIAKKYPGFGPTLAHEKLVEKEGIDIGKQNTRNMMIALKLWTPKPRKHNKEFRSQRERKDCFGEMEQFDGCYHVWFGDFETCLLASADDATGQITWAEFSTSESVANVFGFWQGYVKTLGRPIAIYLDKFGTYKVNHKNAADNSDLITQFQRACRELGITLICANSPQAKGRIERLFLTLQDRLVKELRLRGINDIDSANKFLKEEFIPDFNQRFSVVPKNKTDLHRQLYTAQIKNIDAIFSIRSQRRIQNDFTIRFKNQWIQIAKEQAVTVRHKDEVLIEERLDGSLAIRLRNKYLNFKILPDKPLKVKEIIAVIPAKKTIARPAPDHPWRKQIAAEIAKVTC
jgi:hypothetical protein